MWFHKSQSTQEQELKKRFQDRGAPPTITMNFIKGLARQTGTPPTPLAVSPRSPDVGEVIKGFDIADIATMVVVGGLSFPVGYAIGKPIRTPSMWVMGGLGTVAGFLLGFQNSSGKLQLPPPPPPSLSPFEQRESTLDPDDAMEEVV